MKKLKMEEFKDLIDREEKNKEKPIKYYSSFGYIELNRLTIEEYNDCLKYIKNLGANINEMVVASHINNLSGDDWYKIALKLGTIEKYVYSLKNKLDTEEFKEVWLNYKINPKQCFYKYLLQIIILTVQSMFTAKEINDMCELIAYT